MSKIRTPRYDGLASFPSIVHPANNIVTQIIGTALVGAAFVANILTTIFLFAIDPWQASMVSLVRYYTN
jgi:hypothetical protein